MKKYFFIFLFLNVTCFLLSQKKANKLVEKGNEYIVKLNYEKAEDCFNNALKLDSHCVQAYIQKSDIEIQKNEFERALKFIEQAKKVAENENEKHDLMAHIYSVRSFIFFNQNKYQNAVEDLNMAISLNDHNASYYFMRALIKRMNSDLKGCCSDLKIASGLGLEKAKESLSLYCK